MSVVLPSSVANPDGREWLVIPRTPDGPPREVHQHLPVEGRMVYILAAGTSALYVGQTTRPKIRIQEHCKNGWGRYYRAVTHVFAYFAESELVALLLEQLLHDELRPRWSRVTAPDRARRRALEAAAA